MNDDPKVKPNWQCLEYFEQPRGGGNSDRQIRKLQEYISSLKHEIRHLNHERSLIWSAARSIMGGLDPGAAVPQVFERYTYQTLEDWENSRNG